MHNFKKLKVWEKAVELAIEMYRLTQNFPVEERFGLISQIRKCAVSIASNIAEGAGRNSNGEFRNFLGIAAGSANELTTQLLISCRLKFISEEDYNSVESSLQEIKNMMHSLKGTLN